MTNKWKFQKHREMSDKTSGNLGYMIDVAINTPTYHAPHSLPKVAHGDYMQNMINRFVDCPKCQKQVELIESPGTKSTMKKQFLECSVCHLWIEYEEREKERLKFRESLMRGEKVRF